jgi:hypothetical protein
MSLLSESEIVNYGKKDDFNFVIINFSHLDNNIPTILSYGIYIAQLTF